MADKLADYVVGVGIKGQNVALTEINKIKKAGKELSKMKPKVNFSAVRSEVNARKQLDAIKRQTQATRGQVELQRMQEQKQTQFAQKIRGGAQSSVGVASSAMTGGITGIASQIPVVGALFGAASSAIESAGQEYIQGVTSSKNIQLVTANYSKAFQGAFATGLERVSGSGAFTGLVGKAFYSSLVEQGAKAETVTKAAPGLELLAKSQGVGSIDELMGRLQSGTLKEGAGLSKADITLLQSQSQLLNNRYTSDIGAQMLTQTLQRLTPQMQAVANSQPMQRLTSAVSREASLQDTERYYSAEGASLFGGEDVTEMYANRRADRQGRADALPFAQAVNGVQRNAAQRARNIGRAVTEGDGTALGIEMLPAHMQEAARRQRRRNQQNSGQGVSEGGGGEGPQGPTSGEGASAGPLSMQTDNATNDIARSGQAIAQTLMQINNQLNIVRQQIQRRT